MDFTNLDRIAGEIIEEIVRDKRFGQVQGVTAGGVYQSRKYETGYDENIASIIEHSMIRPDATPEMVKKFCDEAVKYKFANVALAPCFVSLASRLLKGTKVKVATAVSFPMGISTTNMKVAETREAIQNGACEIDLPINIGLVKSGDYKSVKNDIEAVVAAAKKDAVIKVVIDTGALTDEEKIKVGLMAKMAGAHYLKVAAGSKPGGVTVEDVKLMRKVAGNEMRIKADGGIKDYKTALAMVQAGSDRIGASGSVRIVTRG